MKAVIRYGPAEGHSKGCQIAQYVCRPEGWRSTPYRRNAERLRDEMATLPWLECAVHRLARLVAEKESILTM